MHSEREHRLEAARCLLAADQESDPGRRIQLIKTAVAWLEVAVHTLINEQGKSAVVARLRNPETQGAGDATRRRAPIVRAER
jgi:hypothetical protein